MEENLPKFENTDNLMINRENAADLKTAMVWAKFMAIVSFVFTGMFLVGALFMLFGGMSSMKYGMFAGMGAFTGIIWLITTVISFFYSYFILMFSTKIKRAIAENNQQYLNQGILNMKNYFLFSGIMVIVALAFMFLTIAFSGMLFASFL